MRLIVLPISGGKFPVQIAIVESLSDIGYKPDLTLASSGGTVASYCASYGDWKSEEIRKIAKDLSSSLFIRSWFSPHLAIFHSIVAGYFYGAAYQASDTTIDFFEKYFTPLTITQYEIWVGAINRDTGAVCLFCNRSRAEAQIKGGNFNIAMIKSEPLKYLNGNLEDIMNAAMASSSIPIMIEPRVIDGRSYIDIGAKFASPLVPLQEEILELTKSEPLHIIYVNGFNVEADTAEMGDHNMMNGFVGLAEHVVRSFIIQDRQTAINIIKIRSGKDLIYAEFDVGVLDRVLIFLEKECCDSVVEIYPRKLWTIDLETFVGSDVENSIKYHKSALGLRVWWNGNSNIFESVDLQVGPSIDHEFENILDTAILFGTFNGEEI